MVYSSQRPCRFAYHQAASLPSWIEVNCMWSAAVGKAARLLIYWQDAACHVVIPLRQVALAQLNKYHHQSGNAMSGKLVWKQHTAADVACPGDKSLKADITFTQQHTHSLQPLLLHTQPRNNSTLTCASFSACALAADAAYLGDESLKADINWRKNVACDTDLVSLTFTSVFSFSSVIHKTKSSKSGFSIKSTESKEQSW